jgi:hypothetical protein
MAAALTTNSDEAEEACGKLGLEPYEWPSSALKFVKYVAGKLLGASTLVMASISEPDTMEAVRGMQGVYGADLATLLNIKVETRTKEEMRSVEVTSPTLCHVLQCNRRRAFAYVVHFII